MSRDIYEEIAARHLQLKPDVFIRTSHDPGMPGWTAEIDVLALDFGRKTAIAVEVKSGGLGKFQERVIKYEQEIIPRLKAQLENMEQEFATWKIETRLYVKSSYQESAQKITGPNWDVYNLDDAFNELLKN